MTPSQLAEDLERRNREAQQLFDIASGRDSTIVKDAVLAGGASSPALSPDNPLVKQVAQEAVTKPVVESRAAASSPAPSAGAVPVQTPEVETTPSFYNDLLRQNDSVRLRQQEAFDRREKSDKARLTLAAVSDALASLGNLVGTTNGAFSQPQTYQMPFVHEDVERSRSLARQYADMLDRNDQSLRLARAREETANNAAALRQALEEERTRRAAMNNDAKVALAQENARLKAALEGEKHGYRTEEETQKQAGRETLAGINNASREKQTAMRVGVSAANNIRNNERMTANGGGRVGGYTTETTIHRDEYGQETGRTTTRTPANGGPSVTTTSGKKPNPMGAAPQQDGKKKKKNPMN